MCALSHSCLHSHMLTRSHTCCLRASARAHTHTHTHTHTRTLTHTQNHNHTQSPTHTSTHTLCLSFLSPRFQLADIVLKVNPPAVRGGSNELSLVREGSVFISFVGHLDRFETESAPKTEALKDLLLARDRKVTLLGTSFSLYLLSTIHISLFRIHN